jgi:hypothetical protein
VDRIPTQVNYTAEMGNILCRHFGVSPTDLPDRLDNHMIRVDLSHESRLREDGLASAGTGLLIGPSHRMMADVPVENVDAFLEAGRELET